MSSHISCPSAIFETDAGSPHSGKVACLIPKKCRAALQQSWLRTKATSTECHACCSRQAISMLVSFYTLLGRAFSETAAL